MSEDLEASEYIGVPFLAMSGYRQCAVIDDGIEWSGVQVQNLYV